jgi:hypothetical protein
MKPLSALSHRLSVPYFPFSVLRPPSSVLYLLFVLFCATASAQTVISGVTVGGGVKYEAQDPSSLTTNSTVTIQSGGIATFRSSGSLSLQPGFSALSGSFFQASIVTGTSVPLAWTIVSGASGYNVYRDGTKLNGSALTTTSFTDATATAGTTYVYTIKSVTGGTETTLVTYNVATAGPLEVFVPLP